ncbi:hypothetical protein [Cryptosporangium japonicum]|uniref:Uncharacterized protein n=1 Tax=Cryptosporangium japonicum TaxID=80872 RepID=A0ABP3EKY1_9ACTN
MTLLLKLLLAPALVAGSSWAGRRWGAPVTGVLVALPIMAGPILLITCLEQGPEFGSRAAAAALLGLLTLALFTVVFAWCARFTGWVGSLALAWTVCLAADLGLARLTLPPIGALLLVLLAARGALAALPTDRAGDDTGTAPPWPWWDLPGRAAATAVLVVAVTAAAGTIGPGLTGVLAPFPVATSVVAAFVLARQGADAVARTLRGVPRGLLGFAVFCFLVAELTEPLGVATAFVLAVTATLGVQLVAGRVTPTADR